MGFFDSLNAIGNVAKGFGHLEDTLTIEVQQFRKKIDIVIILLILIFLMQLGTCIWLCKSRRNSNYSQLASKQYQPLRNIES